MTLVWQSSREYGGTAPVRNIRLICYRCCGWCVNLIAITGLQTIFILSLGAILIPCLGTGLFFRFDLGLVTLLAAGFTVPLPPPIYCCLLEHAALLHQVTRVGAWRRQRLSLILGLGFHRLMVLLLIGLALVVALE